MADAHAETRTRPKRLMIRLGLGLVVVLAAAAIGIAVVRARMREALRVRLLEEIRERKAAAWPSPVLFGASPEEGDAFRHYDQAIAMMKGPFDSARRMRREPDAWWEAGGDPAETARLAGLEPALEHLRRGLRCRTVREPHDYEHDLERRTVAPYPECLALAETAILDALVRARGGAFDPAARDLIGVLLFGRDVAARGTFIEWAIGRAIRSAAGEGLRAVLPRAGLDAAALRTLGEAVDAVGDGAPGAARALASERITILQTVLTPGGYPDLLPVPLRLGWRWGWPTVEQKLHEIEDLARLPYALAEPAFQVIKQEAERSWNPAVREFVTAIPVHGGQASAAFEQTALRACVAWLEHHARTGRAPADLRDLVPAELPDAPRDPFASGPPLRLLPATGGTPARLVSVGEDQVFDGGDPKRDLVRTLPLPGDEPTEPGEAGR